MSYTDKTLQERQVHLDLDDECIFYYYKTSGKWGNAGDLGSEQMARIKAREALGEYLNTGNLSSRMTHVCHKCKNNSYSHKPCINPKHLYWGTPKENYLDIPEDVRQKVKIAGNKAHTFSDWDKEKLAAIGRKNVIAMNAANNVKVSCKHCGKIGTKGNIARWHNDNCRFKP